MVEEAVLRVFEDQGYAVSSRRQEGPDGGLALMQQGSRRALLRFHWGHSELGEEEIKAFCDVMEDLKADHGYLITNGGFSPEAWDVARQSAVNLTDGSALRDMLFRTTPLLHRVRPEEPPLPFAKYIPWFVGISLAVLAVVVVMLVAVALSMVPAPEA